MVLKLIVAGMAASIEDDKDRMRYSVSYKLVRSDGLGTWKEALEEMLLLFQVCFRQEQPLKLD